MLTIILTNTLFATLTGGTYILGHKLQGWKSKAAYMACLTIGVIFLTLHWIGII